MDLFYFLQIFVTKFNLGFGSLKQDTCSECLAYSIKYKAATNVELKKSLIVERMVHKHRAKAFFQNLNLLSSTTVTINFDLMQNQPLPKTNINQAYYARQMWYYILGIVIVNEDKNISHDTTHFYRWLESDGGRGPNEISSCLWDFFKKILKPLCQENDMKPFVCFVTVVHHKIRTIAFFSCCVSLLMNMD